MSTTPPRLELRVFAPDLAFIEHRMRGLAPCRAIDESREIYILGADCEHRNVKIRGGRLELKVLEGREGDLERWRPAGRWDLPVSRRVALETLFAQRPPAVDLPARPGLEALMSLATRAPDLARANVFKRRFRFTIRGCAAEYDQLRVNGAALESVAVEDADGAAVRAVRSALGLDALDNSAYPLALARVLGLRPLTDGEDYGKGD